MRAITIDEITRETGWAPLREVLGAAAFGVNAWTKAAGENLVGEHDENASGHEELYVVLAGRIRFTVDGEERDAEPGTAVLVPPESRRAAVALEDGSRVLVVGGRPGGVWRRRGWEINATIFPLFGEGRIEEARDLLLAGLETAEDTEVIEYNLACCEARLGNPEEAFAYLRRGIEGRANLADLAREDEDLESLRGDPRFGELVGAAPATTPG
jgi:hypothetical protein